MTVRLANVRDIPNILPLWRVLADKHSEMEPMFKLVDNAEVKFAEYLKKLLVREGNVIFVAEADSKIVGYVIVSVSATADVFVMNRRLYIQDMIISPDYRRIGIGRRLMDSVIRFAKDQQVEKMDLLVAVKNEEVYKFWKTMGFEPALSYMTRYLS